MLPKTIKIRHFVFSRFYHFLLIPFLALLLDQINMINNPQRSPVYGIRTAGFFHYLQYFIQQLYVFELITFAILAVLIRVYLQWFKLKEIKLNIKEVVLFQVKLLPLFLLSIFIFGPITNFFRYYFLLYPLHGWALYFPDFFMSSNMYFNYLFPILIWGYLLINIDLLMSYVTRTREFQPSSMSTETSIPASRFLQIIEGSNNQGSMMLGTNEVLYFEVEKKNYYAHKSSWRYAIKKTLAELEQELNPADFFRINRSQIIGIHHIKNYSYWEFEKYIVRLNGVDETDFVITRKRLKELKLILEALKSG